MNHGAEDDFTLSSELWIDFRAGKKGMEETLVQMALPPAQKGLKTSDSLYSPGDLVFHADTLSLQNATYIQLILQRGGASASREGVFMALYLSVF